MILELLPCRFSVCRVKRQEAFDCGGDFVFTARTDREWSLVCQTEFAPAASDCDAREDGWRAFRVAGVLDFSLIGILAGLSGVLARAGVGIFAVSTYDTDYILFREQALDMALAALRDAGYQIEPVAIH